MGDGLEPSPETPARLVLEVAEAGDQLEQHMLGHVLGVGILEAPDPAPSIDLPAVMLDELGPGGRIALVSTQATQQGDPCVRFLGSAHGGRSFS